MDIKSIEKATGKSWTDWLKFFDSIDARHLSHQEIATKVFDAGTPAWWAQNVTVAYEQHIGRREPGQRVDGSYEVSVTKIFEGTLDQAMDWWQDKVADSNEFMGVSFADQPSDSQTEKWRHWRVNLEDGGKVLASTMQKTPAKAQLAVTVQKLASAEDAEKWRAYWKRFLSS